MKMDQDNLMNRINTYFVTRNTPARAGGIVLLVTLVVLLVLATLVYNLASWVAAQRHRSNYIIDYTVACYARDSAVKYALATLQDMNNIELISRPNEPDFSDLFALSEPDYRQMLAQWAEEFARKASESAQAQGASTEEPAIGLEDLEAVAKNADTNDSNQSNLAKNIEEIAAILNAEPNTNTLDQLKVRGPYGPAWPFVTEPVEFEIGPAKVKIEIEDENAKYPAGWAILDDENVQREAQAGLDTFCEWMGLDAGQIYALKEQLKQVGSIRPFKMDFKALAQKTPVSTVVPANRRRGVRQQRTVIQTKTLSPAEQFTKQARDFSKLFHSSIIDTEMLAAPTIISEERKESALKYMDLWGTAQVNINSAPRQVLEAAFTFGGDAQQVADEIIKKRREKPFASIDDLKKEFFRFSDSIEKSKPYITAASNVFTIRVTAVSGTAKASAVIVVLREGGKIERIAFASG